MVVEVRFMFWRIELVLVEMGVKVLVVVVSSGWFLDGYIFLLVFVKIGLLEKLVEVIDFRVDIGIWDNRFEDWVWVFLVDDDDEDEDGDMEEFCIVLLRFFLILFV